MINKRTFIFPTLAEALAYKISADPRNLTYRQGSFTIEPIEGEPDISYYSAIMIRETNQIWQCGQFWLNDIHRDADNDLITEHAERVAADARLQNNIDKLDEYRVLTEERYHQQQITITTIDEEIQSQAEQIAAIGLKVDNLAEQLITMDEYRNIKPKAFQTYFVARNEEEKLKFKCWRIYLRTQLIGEFEISGKLTMPKFPMRFPFRFA